MAFPMRILRAVVLSFASLASLAYGQLSSDFVSNAASYIYPPLPNSSVAQGAFFAILGTGGKAPGAVSVWDTYPLPTSLGGTSVVVTVNGTTTAAFIYYVGPSWSTSGTQIDAVMPSTTPTGTGTIVVTQNGTSSPPFPVTVVTSSPGTYSLDGAGIGPGVFYNVASDGSEVQNNLFKTAKPGQIVELQGTGLAPAADPSREGAAPPKQLDVRNNNFLVDVWVGNQQATVLYAGRSSYTAEDEIAFTVPIGVSGCYNEVAVLAGPPGGQVVSNFTSLAVDPAGAPCQDADGINMNDLVAAIESKGSANVGAISLISNYSNLTVPFLGTLEWDEDTVNGEIATLNAQQLDASLGFTMAPSVNNCAVEPYLGYPPPIDPVLASVFGPLIYLDAGSSLSIQGPNGTKPVPKNADGDDYFALVGGETIADLLIGGGLPPFFLSDQGWGTGSWTYAILPGTYTVAGPGGSNVGAFSASLAVSAAAASFQWTNQSIIASSPIPRTTPLTITWIGGDPDGFVQIVASASTLQSGVTPSPTTPGVFVECIAPASAGAFTIPVDVLQSFPSTTTSTALLPPGSLMVGPASGAVTFPVTPFGLDAAYVFYHYAAGTSVAWQ